MKKTIAILLSFLVCFLFISCGNPSSTENTSDVLAESEPIGVEGFDLLGGTWAVGGIYNNGKLYDVHDNAALEGLFDTEMISFSENGSFEYLVNVFVHKGEYLPYQQSDSDNISFLLKTTTVYRLSYQNDELVTQPSEDTGSNYLISFMQGDDHAFVLSEFDSILGKAKPSDDPVLFVKKGYESSYLAAHKVGASSSSSNQTTTKAPTTSQAVGVATFGEKNALEKAKAYLNSSAFSYSGLIEQLEYEGYSKSEATYGADHCGADWTQQASRKANQYLNSSAFSASGLREQLEYEGFTEAQASNAVEHCGADWNEQAYKKAKQYLNVSSFSKSGLIEQLEYEGFTPSQAQYGADRAYS